MTQNGGQRILTVMLVPDGGHESRTYRFSYRVLRLAAALGAGAALALTLVAGSWWYLAARAARVAVLESQVEALQARELRVQELAAQLEVIEQRYGHLRGMLGAGAPEPASEAWLPPASGTPRRSADPERGAATLPTSWPLTERGFVTQGLLEGQRAEHPGLDIAIPTDSYIRAAGAGTVVDVGEDDVYGRFVVIDHGEGYSSLYAHASLNVVRRGQRVRRNEVIALSGSTGRSTAPHLHFEILLNGEAVDPLTLVRQP